MKGYLLLLAISFHALLLQAQQSAIPLLERRVTILANLQTIESVLNDISQQAGCIFSYSPEAIPCKDKVTIKAVNKPVKLVLSDIFNDRVNYKTKGKYIILKKNNPSRKNNKSTAIQGYVFDEKSGEKLIGASVYDKKLLISAITNEYGYFSMDVPADKPLPSLHISKLGYSDTVLLAQADKQRKMIIEIALNSQDTAIKKKKLVDNFQDMIPTWLIPKKLKIHSLNLSDSIFKKVHFSLAPMVSSNQLLTGNIENDISINLTLGYVYSVRIAEFGGILNAVRTDAGVCQLAGVGNIVGRTSHGLQGAGVFNHALSATGIQCAGVTNITSNWANVQAAGVINLSEESNIQVSGVINSTKKIRMFQATGVINNAPDANVQLAGVVNLAKKANGFQVAGIMNHARAYSNIQVAGVLNNAGTANFQISGFLNKAQHVKTLQFSVVNISDTCAGTPIGVFNYVKTGYHKLEFYYDESSFAGLAFRSGVKHFHTIFMAGALMDQFKNNLYTYGYGMGASFGNAGKTLFDIDLSSSQIIPNGNFGFDCSLHKLYLGIDRKIFKKLSFAAGISYNLLISDTRSEYYQSSFVKIGSYAIINRTLSNGINLKTWFGGKIALRVW